MPTMQAKTSNAQSKKRPPSAGKNNGVGRIQQVPVNVKFPSGSQTFMGSKTRDSFLQDEYIAEVTSTTGAASSFNVTSYAFNPGQAATFPRFYREAVLYEKWICTAAEFYYKPQVSQYATAGTTGKVILSFDYDGADAAPSTKVQVEDTDPHSDGMPWQSINLKLDCKELNAGNTGKFVRPAGLPGATDIRLYDGGRLHVSTTGITNGGANVTLGELRVRYRFMLSKPVLENTSLAPQNFHTSSLRSSANESLSSGVQTTLALATTDYNGIGVINSSGNITLPAGNYLLHADVKHGGTAITGSIITLFVDGVAYGGNAERAIAAGAVMSVDQQSISKFVVSTGTTVVALKSTLTATGSPAAVGSLIILSV